MNPSYHFPDQAMENPQINLEALPGFASQMKNATKI